MNNMVKIFQSNKVNLLMQLDTKRSDLQTDDFGSPCYIVGKGKNEAKIYVFPPANYSGDLTVEDFSFSGTTHRLFMYIRELYALRNTDYIDFSIKEYMLRCSLLDRKQARKQIERDLFALSAVSYITAEGQHDAIIDKPQFEAAQRHRASLSRTCEKREDSTHVHLLATLVRCPVCGAKMYGNTSRKRKKDGSGEYYTHYHFYGCKHRREIEGKPCTFKDNISEDKIDKPVVDVLCMLASNQTLANKIAEKVGSVTDEADVVTAMGAIQRLIDKKRAAAKSATKKILLFDDDSAGADKILEDMKEEINNLYASIDELTADLDREKAKLAAIRENKLTTQRIYEILERFKDLYDVMSPEDRQLLMRTLVKEIHIYENVQPDNKLVKKIVLNIPIGYDGDTPYVTISPTAAGLDKKMIDESIVCMARD